MADIPWPKTHNPGLKPQEGTGKLTNVFVELTEAGDPVWRRAPGAIVFAREPSAGSATIEITANARGEAV